MRWCVNAAVRKPGGLQHPGRRSCGNLCLANNCGQQDSQQRWQTRAESSGHVASLIRGSMPNPLSLAWQKSGKGV